MSRLPPGLLLANLRRAGKGRSDWPCCRVVCGDGFWFPSPSFCAGQHHSLTVPVLGPRKSSTAVASTATCMPSPFATTSSLPRASLATNPGNGALEEARVLDEHARGGASGPKAGQGHPRSGMPEPPAAAAGRNACATKTGVSNKVMLRALYYSMRP